MSAPSTYLTTERVPRGPFWIYRAINDRGELVYLGKTNDLKRRYDQHCDEKWWLREVVDWRVNVAQTWATEAEVLAAEKAAIKAERPIVNVEHNEDNPNRVDPHTMLYANTGKPYRPEIYADVHAGVPASWRPMKVGQKVTPRPDRPRGQAYRSRASAGQPRRAQTMSRGRRRAWGYAAVWAVGYLGSVSAAWGAHVAVGWPLWALLVAPAVPPSLVLLWWSQLTRHRRRVVLAWAGVVACLVVLGAVLWAVYGDRIAEAVSR